MMTMDPGSIRAYKGIRSQDDQRQYQEDGQGLAQWTPGSPSLANVPHCPKQVGKVSLESNAAKVGLIDIVTTIPSLSIVCDGSDSG